MPPGSIAATVYVMSRLCRSVKVAPSVTTYCRVSTLVLSTVGAYTSDSTPPATVYQTFDAEVRAVPTQSLRARSKWDSTPGAPAGGSAAAAGTAATAGTASRAASSVTIARILVTGASHTHSGQRTTARIQLSRRSWPSRPPGPAPEGDSTKIGGDGVVVHPERQQPAEVGDELVLLVRGVGAADGVHQQRVEV